MKCVDPKLTEFSKEEAKLDALIFRSRFSRDPDVSREVGYMNWRTALQEEDEVVEVGDDKEDPLMPRFLGGLIGKYNMSENHRNLKGSLPGMTVNVSLEETKVGKKTRLNVGYVTFNIGEHVLRYDMNDMPDDVSVLTDMEDKIYQLAKGSCWFDPNSSVDMRDLITRVDVAARFVKASVDAGERYKVTRDIEAADNFMGMYL